MSAVDFGTEVFNGKHPITAKIVIFSALLPTAVLAEASMVVVPEQNNMNNTKEKRGHIWHSESFPVLWVTGFLNQNTVTDDLMVAPA